MDLTSNSLGAEGGVVLRDSLEENMTVVSLDVRVNKISADVVSFRADEPLPPPLIDPRTREHDGCEPRCVSLSSILRHGCEPRCVSLSSILRHAVRNEESAGPNPLTLNVFGRR